MVYGYVTGTRTPGYALGGDVKEILLRVVTSLRGAVSLPHRSSGRAFIIFTGFESVMKWVGEFSVDFQKTDFGLLE